MAAFDYRQAEEIRDKLAAHGVRYLFLGKSGAILLGFPDTTQDADLFIERTAGNGRALASALLELGFALTGEETREIEGGKDFIQLKNGPFDLDLIFARGFGGLRWKAFRSAIWTTSSQAKQRPTGRRTGNRSLGCVPSATGGNSVTKPSHRSRCSGGPPSREAVSERRPRTQAAFANTSGPMA